MILCHSTFLRSLQEGRIQVKENSDRRMGDRCWKTEIFWFPTHENYFEKIFWKKLKKLFFFSNHLVDWESVAVRFTKFSKCFYGIWVHSIV